MSAASVPSGRSAPVPPRDDALPRGTRLEGCVVESVLAESGFSIVYRARAPDGARLLAVKEYLPVALAMRGGDGFSLAPRGPSHAAAFAAGLSAFAHEAELLARCRHPSLLPVLGVWQAHGTVYRAMPLLEGKSLPAQRAAMASPPDEAAVRRLLDALCGALQVLHDAGQAHGDVSPANILLRDDDGRPVLLDTGAVRRAVLHDDTRALMALLEPAHSCAAAGAAADPQRADLCALAAVAAFWITGRMPEPAVPGQPPPLAAAVQAMQARDPALHYDAPLVAAIDAVLTGSGAAAAQSIDAFRRALLGRAASLPVQAGQPPVPAHPGTRSPAATPASAAPSARPSLVAAAAAAAAAPVARAAGLKSAAAPTASVSAPTTTAPAAAARQQMSPSLAPASPPAAASAHPQAPAATAPTPPAPAAAAPKAATAPFEPVRVETRRGYPRRKEGHGARWFAVAVVAFVLAVGAWVFQQQRTAFQERAARAAAAEREATAAAAARALADAPPAAGPAPSASGAAPAGPAGSGRIAAPTKPTSAKPAVPPATPRAACGDRTPFSLYRCMQAECRKPQWAQHSQCIKMSRSGIVD
jgi:Protein kinase domain